jgi:hypothetical protein
MFVRVLIYFVAVLTIGCVERDPPIRPSVDSIQSSAGQPAATPDSSWRIADVRDVSDGSRPGHASSVILFGSGDSLVVPLLNLKVLSTLNSEDGLPWIVVAGVECSSCDAPEIVVFLRAARGHLKMPLKAYAFPGDQYEGAVEGQVLLARNRMFLGACLKSAADAVALEERPDSAGTWVKSIRTISLDQDLNESVHVWNPSVEQHINQTVTRGSCKEITGKTQYVL